MSNSTIKTNSLINYEVSSIIHPPKKNEVAEFKLHRFLN